MTAEFRLRECRERAGMSQEQLARQIGWHVNAIRFYEGPRTDYEIVTWGAAVALRRALGCSLDELAGIEPPEQDATR